MQFTQHCISTMGNRQNANNKKIGIMPKLLTYKNASYLRG